MKKFEIKKESIEISYKNRSNIITGCTFNQADHDTETVKSFDSKESALSALKSFQTDITELSGANGIYYAITEFYVEENEYDEDGEWIYGGSIWEYTQMPEMEF